MDRMTISHNLALEGNFFAHKKEDTLFFTQCVYAQNAQIFMENANVHENMKKIFIPLPILTQPGFLVCHGGGGGLCPPLACMGNSQRLYGKQSAPVWETVFVYKSFIKN